MSLGSQSYVSEADVLRLKERDPAYLDQFFRETNPRLLKILGSRGVSGEIAEDLVHECWETFFEKMDHFEGRAQLQTFVIGILLNKLRENRRREGKIDYEEDSERVFAKSFTDQGWWAQAPVDPKKTLIRRQLGAAIQSCMEGLTEAQRNAFLLIELEGESSENVSNILGVTLSHLRVLLFRAKSKLRLCLEGSGSA